MKSLDIIKNTLTERKISQTRLADELKVSPSTISDLLGGKNGKYYGWKLRYRIAIHLGLDPDLLLSDIQKQRKPFNGNSKRKAA